MFDEPVAIGNGPLFIGIPRTVDGGQDPGGYPL